MNTEPTPSQKSRDRLSPAPLPRRNFLKGIASTSGVLAIGTATAGAAVATAADPSIGYQSPSPDEGAFTEALLNVMCPADEFTPSGVECGLARFFDRQLAGGFGRGDRLYRQPPVRTGKPEAGYQLPLTPEQFYKAGVAAAQAACSNRLEARFEELDAVRADAFLLELAAGKLAGGRVPLAQWFNELVYPLFVQACYSDPLYGGNRGKVFWKLIGYPGLPAFHTQNMVTYRGKPFPGAFASKSIQDFS